MDIVLNIKKDGKPTENDIIAFIGGEWRVVNKSRFFSKELQEQKLKNDNYEERIKTLEKNLKKLAEIIKEK